MPEACLRIVFVSLIVKLIETQLCHFECIGAVVHSFACEISEIPSLFTPPRHLFRLLLSSLPHHLWLSSASLSLSIHVSSISASQVSTIVQNPSLAQRCSVL